MKLLFVRVQGWLGTHTGGLHAQRLCAEGLAESGHECHGLVRLFDPRNDRPHLFGKPTDAEEFTFHQTRAALIARNIQFTEVGGHSIRFKHNGVTVHAVGGTYGDLCDYARKLQADHRFDWITVNEMDEGPPLLRTLQEISGGKVLMTIQAVQTLPFGPLTAIGESAETTAEMKRCKGFIVFSKFCQDYVRTHGGIEAHRIGLSTYGKPPFEHYRNFEGGYVTMINPGLFKGINIFLALAKAMPHVRFAAVPTWSTAEDDRKQLADLPNMAILPQSDNIDDIYRSASIVLAPGIWEETFGLTVVEAMLRGVPVLASALGGHAEAKLGVPYLIPTEPIRYRVNPQTGAREPVVPVPDINPWKAAIDELLSSQQKYEEVAAQSRQAATQYVESLSWNPVIDYLKSIS